ncbi:helix-turn-helix domain-containing protein [Allokutzneria albata]|uniref:HTH cro/C1-type domain-containing protein n=1 Tax=Allokutzneria albata TaxID=211114 RepID=A0A1H0DSI8_ALLAB|nr:helix-turn-helix domain-containing protein [Allokutzneria albata]SDN73122.1 hypothetical protein SAMN04489726_7971 [Allokutzneria albata]
MKAPLVVLRSPEDLVKALADCGMRQQRLADAANTSRQRIHQLCKGHAPRTSTALADRIEKALGRPRGSLFVHVQQGEESSDVR